MGRKSRFAQDPALERAVRACAERGMNPNQIVASLGAGGITIGYEAVRNWMTRAGFGSSIRKNENRTRDDAPADPTPHRTADETIAHVAAAATEAIEGGTVSEVRERYSQIRELVTMALEDVRASLAAKSVEPGPTLRLQRIQQIENQLAKTLVAIEPKADLEVARLESLGETARQALIERARAALATPKGTP